MSSYPQILRNTYLTLYRLVVLTIVGPILYQPTRGIPSSRSALCFMQGIYFPLYEDTVPLSASHLLVHHMWRCGTFYLLLSVQPLVLLPICSICDLIWCRRPSRIAIELIVEKCKLVSTLTGAVAEVHSGLHTSSQGRPRSATSDGLSHGILCKASMDLRHLEVVVKRLAYRLSLVVIVSYYEEDRLSFLPELIFSDICPDPLT